MFLILPLNRPINRYPAETSREDGSLGEITSKTVGGLRRSDKDHFNSCPWISMIQRLMKPCSFQTDVPMMSKQEQMFDVDLRLRLEALNKEYSYDLEDIPNDNAYLAQLKQVE